MRRFLPDLCSRFHLSRSFDGSRRRKRAKRRIHQKDRLKKAGIGTVLIFCAAKMEYQCRPGPAAHGESAYFRLWQNSLPSGRHTVKEPEKISRSLPHKKESKSSAFATANRDFVAEPFEAARKKRTRGGGAVGRTGKKRMGAERKDRVRSPACARFT